MPNWNHFIFSEQPFEIKVIEILNYQYKNNPVYQRFCNALDATPDKLRGDISKIPLLPVRAFKEAEVTTGKVEKPDLVFKSSGTGNMQRSRHIVANEEIYRQAVLKGFCHFYDLDNAVFLGYTPGYAANPHSSLVWMIRELIQTDKIKKSRFLPLNKPLSQGEIDDIDASGRQIFLFGAAFGLLDLAEISPVELPSNSVVLETGGMKTHRREMSRQEMHQELAHGFKIDIRRIHSEYGMCELLSQAYATGGQWFRSVPWMQVAVYDPDDPQRRLEPFQKGLIGIIDLANVDSCPFILTEDRGVVDKKGRFKVLGRWNPQNLRGCNFLIDED
jgi:hypothetical protein